MRTRAERLALLAASRLYVIGPADLRAGRLAEQLPEMAQAGATVFQLRDRTIGRERLIDEARACAAAARAAGALLLVNDDPELAMLVDADGVHLGQDDGAIDWGRGIVGPDRIVGRTTRGGDALAQAAAEGADYASVSPLWATPTKPDREPTGLANAIAAVRDGTIPWFALGGLDPQRVRRLGALGVPRVAAVREIAEAENPATAVTALLDALDTAPRVLTLAGSDSGGAAGIQADVKAIATAGGYPLTAITALTAQDTLGVHAVHPVPAAFVAQQARVVIDDLGVDAVKTGMLGSADVVEAVAGVVASLDPTLLIPVVVDPVMRAESGAALLDVDARRTLLEVLLPHATVATPNLLEAQALAGLATDDAAELARAIHDRAGCAVIVTGGHGPSAADTLCVAGSITAIPGERHPARTTHGAGCTYASTLATLLGGGVPLAEAATRAKAVASGAVLHGRHYGAGAGPVDVTRWRG
ncbi:MAG: bifunctional hydroxymethylpyrimidine kinase/phosphomethylpyrimidine kinase [Gaiellales bacterium]